MNYKKMNVKLFFDRLVDAKIIADFKLLWAFKSKIKLLKREEPEHKVLAEQIKKLRSLIKSKAHSHYRVRVQNGRWYNEQIYTSIPDAYAFKEVVDDYISDIKDIRAQFKEVQKERKTIMGFQYTTIGNVFNEYDSIIKIGNSSDPMSRISVAKVPHKKIAAQYVGIELELMCKISQQDLNTRFIKEKLAGNVYIKTDSSIRVEEDNERGHEVTLLCRQEDITDVMTRVGKVLNGKDVKAKVNNSCGFHLHIDVRHRDPYKTYNNLVKALSMLNSMVPYVRVKGEGVARYCKQNTVYDLNTYFPDPANFRNTRSGREDRYQAINPYSVLTHNTIEVRLHSGTTNTEKVIMWTKICLAIADAPALTEKIETVNDFTRLVSTDSKMIEYINKRVALFKNKETIDTRADYVLDLVNEAG